MAIWKDPAPAAKANEPAKLHFGSREPLPMDTPFHTDVDELEQEREILAKVRSTDIRVQELDQQLTDGADAKKGGISRRILDSLARLEARKP